MAVQETRLIILDRDGVINEDSDAFIKSPDEWQPIAGSLEAISKLHKQQYTVVVISNQSGVARGLLSVNALNRIHQKMLDEVHQHGGEISAIFFCQHGPDDDCDCRKPKPGLFHEVGRRLSHDLGDVPAVGDSIRDLEAAEAAGAIPILVRTGKGQRSLKMIAEGDAPEFCSKVPVYENLLEYVEELLAGQ